MTTTIAQIPQLLPMTPFTITGTYTPNLVLTDTNGTTSSIPLQAQTWSQPHVGLPVGSYPNGVTVTGPVTGVAVKSNPITVVAQPGESAQGAVVALGSAGQ